MTKVSTKTNNIRRKALEHAKKREWDKALVEFVRLAEIEDHNPNVFNELGDLHLKLGNKREAFEAFHSAIDAYSGVALYNNAVAVCKKIIRLNPNDLAVYGKLARLRSQQGFKKEASTYAGTYLERVAQEAAPDKDHVGAQLSALGREMMHAPDVVERIADQLIEWELTQAAGDILERLVKACREGGMSDRVGLLAEKMDRIGMPVPPSAGETEGARMSEPTKTTDGATAAGTVSMPADGGDAPASEGENGGVVVVPPATVAPASDPGSSTSVDAHDGEGVPEPGRVFDLDADGVPSLPDVEIPAEEDTPDEGRVYDLDAEPGARPAAQREADTKTEPDGAGAASPTDRGGARTSEPVPEERGADVRVDVEIERHRYEFTPRRAHGPATQRTTRSQVVARMRSGRIGYDVGSIELDGSDSPVQTATQVEEPPAETRPEKQRTRDTERPPELAQERLEKTADPEATAALETASPPRAVPDSEYDPHVELPEETPRDKPNRPSEDSSSAGDAEVWIPREELPSGLPADDEAGATVTVSDIIDHFASEVRSDVESEDHRSHYDLGMAYLEMELLPEAVREFQFASHSGTYRVRCLEMIGLCFLRQNQPRLAIKQLELGLQLVNHGERESLGLQYNLGLAYEMIGEFDRAKACFEIVYVVDVGFRDVSAKFEKYAT